MYSPCSSPEVARAMTSRDFGSRQRGSLSEPSVASISSTPGMSSHGGTSIRSSISLMATLTSAARSSLRNAGKSRVSRQSGPE